MKKTDGKNLFDPKHPIWDGTEPRLLMPEGRPFSPIQKSKILYHQSSIINRKSCASDESVKSAIINPKPPSRRLIFSPLDK
jgi:hypothetical protein